MIDPILYRLDAFLPDRIYRPKPRVRPPWGAPERWRR